MFHSFHCFFFSLLPLFSFPRLDTLFCRIRNGNAAIGAAQILERNYESTMKLTNRDTYDVLPSNKNVRAAVLLALCKDLPNSVDFPVADTATAVAAQMAVELYKLPNLAARILTAHNALDQTKGSEKDKKVPSISPSNYPEFIISFSTPSDFLPNLST